MTTEQKEWIDNASYETLFTKWRFTLVGDPLLQGNTGDYYSKIMAEKKPSDEEHTRISKKIGWER